MGHLVILGDLFEFFFGFQGPSSAVPFIDYLPVLEGLQSLDRQGIQIKYFEGNHDFFLHSFFSEKFGMKVEVYPEGHEEHLAGKRVFVSHGDLSNPKMWEYRAFRKIIKNRWTYRLIQIIGPSVTCRVAQKLSDRSYHKHHTDLPSSPPLSFKAFAHKKFLEGFDMVILGHSHFPEEVVESIHERRCLYYNVGDWMVHRSFLRFTPPEYFKLDRYLDGEIG